MRLTCILMLSLLFWACSRKNLSAEIKDKDLLIQAMFVKGDGEERYQVRISSLAKEDQGQQKLTEKMSYGMDTVFYKNINGIKEYPEVVIPVSNGLKNCFEYLLVFSKPKDSDVAPCGFTYHDKNINGKIYKVSIR